MVIQKDLKTKTHVEAVCLKRLFLLLFEFTDFPWTDKKKKSSGANHCWAPKAIVILDTQSCIKLLWFTEKKSLNKKKKT